MLINKYFLLLLPIGLTALTISHKSARLVTAHSFDRAHHSQNIRVGFNPQMVQMLWVANRAQQAYYFEQGRFAENAEELSISGFNLADNDNYKLTIESKNNSAFIDGIPKQDYGTYKEWSGSRWKDAEEPLYSYVSAIAYLKETGSFQSILCVSKTIGKQELAKPEVVDGKFTCSQNTEEIP